MERFADLARGFLDDELEGSPVMATHLGVPGYDDRLDDVSASAFEARRRRSAEWLVRFRDVPETALDPEARRDRGLVVSVLTGREIMADWTMWRRQPDVYSMPCLGGVFALFLHRLRPEPELVRDAIARLRAVPEALGHGKANLQPELCPRLYVERALGQVRAGARYLSDLLPQEVRDPTARGALAEAGRAAAAAFEDFRAFLTALAPRASGAWAIGETRYSRLLREKELLPEDARGLRALGQREYERLADELGGLARRIAGSDDWPRLLLDLNRDHPHTPEAMRAAYEEWTERARRFLRDHGLVTLPTGEECRVEPAPPFQRPVLAVASYQSPPPFSSSMTGHFFVPFPPDGAGPGEVQQRLENNSYAAIPTTAVHEAYPGHHWHLVTAKAHPSALRRVFRTAYFSEGWALYAEQMMREQGFFTDPRQELSQVEALLFRAARIVVDTSLHLEEMTVEDAVSFMRTRANLPEPTARAEVARYAAWPTQAASYLTGCLQILDVRRRYLARLGRSDAAALRRFHDTLARSGGLPVSLAESALGDPTRAQ
jgi:uncharacterized protein (DUF885 family)